MENQMPDTERQMPMGWHKFQVYFSLWLSAIVSIVACGAQLAALILAGASDRLQQVYERIGGIYEATIIMNLLGVALGIATIVVCIRLARLRRNAPRQLITLQLASLVSGLLFALLCVAVFAVPGEELLDAEMLRDVVIGIVTVAINWIYYRKREHLFVN